MLLAYTASQVFAIGLCPRVVVDTYLIADMLAEIVGQRTLASVEETVAVASVGIDSARDRDVDVQELVFVNIQRVDEDLDLLGEFAQPLRAVGKRIDLRLLDDHLAIEVDKTEEQTVVLDSYAEEIAAILIQSIEIRMPATLCLQLAMCLDYLQRCQVFHKFGHSRHTHTHHFGKVNYRCSTILNEIGYDLPICNGILAAFEKIFCVFHNLESFILGQCLLVNLLFLVSLFCKGI